MSIDINNLSKQDQAKLNKYLKKYDALSTSTEPCDRPKAEKTLTDMYNYLKANKMLDGNEANVSSNPEFVWVDSPYEGAKLTARLVYGKMQKDNNGKYVLINANDDVTPEQIREQAGMASYGSFEAYWVAYLDFAQNEIDKKEDELTRLTKEVVENCGVFWTLEDCIVISEKPIKVTLKEINGEQKLHDTEDFALKFKDGSGIFAIEGERKKSLMDVVLDSNYSTTENKKK